MRFAVIMAGGAGKRLWPFSRRHRPKQLLPLVAGRSLLEIAVDRLTGLFEPENISVVTNAEYADQVAQTLSRLPRENTVGEPLGRDTANAIALATVILSARDADATMAVFTADHVIRPTERFAETVRTACEVAERHEQALLTFGIRPTWPHTGLGYVHCGQEVSDGVFRVRAFKEKPDHQTARRYTESGQYYWNSGMFVWKVGAIRAALEEFLPSSMSALEPVAQALRAGQDITEALAEAYPKLEKISIDYAVMEKAREVLMVHLDCEWLDVGSWGALENVCTLDEANNAVLAENAVILDGTDNVIVAEGDHLLAVVGMEECVVVHTPDATLVCNKSDSQRLKQLVGLIEKRFGPRHV